MKMIIKTMNLINCSISFIYKYHIFSYSKMKIIGSRNKLKNMYPIMNEKHNHSINSHPLTNLSIKNQKLVESLIPSINMMNRTTADSLYKSKSKDITTKIPYKIKKLHKNFKKPIKRFNSTVELNKKKIYRSLKQKKVGNNSQNSYDNKYKNSSTENVKVSLQIFNDLDRIQKTLLGEFTKLSQMKISQKPEQNKKKLTQSYNNNNDEENKTENKVRNIHHNSYVINYFNKNRDNKYYTVPIKSRSCYNFFPINQSHKIISDPLNIKTPQSHKRLNSTDDNKPKNITRYLERTKINDLPVTYPLYLSYNNKYNSISEKNRVDKILNKLICLKTHLLRDPLNKKEIIKEFFLRNGFVNNLYFTDESINNFLYYLKQPFSFSPECTLSDVVNEAINFKNNKDENENNDMSIEHFFEYIPKNRRLDNISRINNKKDNNKSNSLGNEIIYNLLMEEIFKRRYINYDNFRNKTLPILIKDLEYELRQIKIDKMNKLDVYNSLISTRKLQTIKLIDNNKYVPNLCLVSKGFKEKCKAVIDKKNKKIMKNMNKQEHLKQINNRLYYDNIRKNNLIEFDRNDIQRKLKLTEFVVMERAKKKLQFQKANNSFINILDRLKKKE